MTQDDGRLAHVVQIAYELARTGDFEDFDSIEREVIAEGFSEGVHWIERPGVRHALGEICHARRQTPAWRSDRPQPTRESRHGPN